MLMCTIVSADTEERDFFGFRMTARIGTVFKIYARDKGLDLATLCFRFPGTATDIAHDTTPLKMDLASHGATHATIECLRRV